MSNKDLDRLLPRHFEVMELVLRGNGPSEIAQVMGMSPQGISLIINAPLFQDALTRRRDQMQKNQDEGDIVASVKALEVLENAAVDAAKTHVSLLESSDPRVAAASANAILDRVLEKKTGVQANVFVFDEKALNALKSVMQESKDSRKNVPSIVLEESKKIA